MWVVVLTEAWVAFSLYGMMALLVLYMRDFLLKPEHFSHVWGADLLQSFIGALYAPAGIVATAAAIMGLFTALTFATPLLGGIIADRYIGRTKTILLGSVLMTIGHVLMAFEQSFVLALLFLLVGIGCAGSLKAQVGALYAVDDRRRSDAYQIYSLGVQVAVIVSPILCASLGAVAWHLGFLAAGIGMALGLASYLLGRRWLPPEPVRAREKTAATPLTPKQRQAVLLLVGLIVVFAIGAVPNEEIFDGYLLWANEHYRLSLFSYDFPVSDLISLDGFISSVTAIGVLWFWRAYAKRFSNDPPEIVKVAIGSFIAAVAPLCLALGVWLYPGPHQVSLLWGIAFHTINDIGFGMVYPIGMALFSRVAPASMNTLFVSGFTLHLFLSNLMIGKLASLITVIPGVQFWVLHAVFAVVAAVILSLCALFFRDVLAPTATQEM